MEKYSMSKKELKQIELFALLKNGSIELKKAIEYSPVGERQTRRNYKKYRDGGPEMLIHKSRGKPSNRAIPQAIIQMILELLTTIYSGFGPTLASEKLEEGHDIKIDHETIRRLMIENNIYTPRKKKAIQREWREPKEHKGELAQLDGSWHQWFIGDDRYYSLIAFIDDATKEVFARFADESTTGVSATLREYIEQKGIPRKLYCDRGKVFKVNNGINKGAKTQFGRMCDELDCEISYARSPQAKGRVERLFRTLQDRLMKELKLKGITTVEDANKMLDAYLITFNKKFCVIPKKTENMHRSAEKYDLNSIFCLKYKRKLNNDYTISYKNRWYQLLKKQPLILYSRDTIDVYANFDGTISLWKNGIRLNCKSIEKPVKKPIIRDEYATDKRTFPRKAPDNHPWKRMVERDIKQVVISNELRK